MDKRKNQIIIYLTESENKAFREAFARSSDSKLSVFGRRLLLAKPVRTYYRDRAFDEFIEVALDFRRDISIILQRPEWNESEKARLKNRIEEMNEFHIKIYEHVKQNNQNKKRP